MIRPIIFCLVLVLGYAVIPAFGDVFWITRYGNISWQKERTELDNVAIQLLKHPEYIAYIYVNAGSKACKGEAEKRAIRAKEYMVKVRGLPADKVVWKDIGYDEEVKVVIYLFDRMKPIPFNPVYQPAQEGQIINKCSSKLKKSNS